MASERVQYPEIQNVEFSSVADADKCRRIAQAYKKATIEQCAQIADKVGAEDVCETCGNSSCDRVAAAIRSIAQPKSEK